MAMTLVEASKYSNDVLQRGVIELLVKHDPILTRLPFKDIRGNGLTYDVETTISGSDFYSVGDTWVEDTSTVTQHTAHTKILGGDADVDEYLRTTRSNMNDLMSEQIESKAKSMRRAFLDTFFYGYAATETKRFDGLHQLMTSETYNTVASGSSETPAACTMIALEEANDLITDGDADICVMTKKMRREINQYLNGVGGITKMDIQGKTVQTINEVPLVVSDHLSNDEACDKDYGSGYGHQPTDGTELDDDDDATTVFFIQFGSKACSGLQSGGALRVKRFRDELETKNAKRVRLIWYPGLMLQSIITCSKLTGLAPATTVTA